MTERDGARGGPLALTTGRPVAVGMAFVTLFTFGWVSLQHLPLNLLPDISYPRVTVRAEYPGAAPEDVEERVTKRLHETLSVLPHLESISSISRAGLADVTLEFGWGTQLTFAIQDIRERLDRSNLPLEVGTPIILRYDPTLDPVMVFGLTGNSDRMGERELVELRNVAQDRLAPAMSTIEGVAAVRVRGGLESEIQVRLHTDRLAYFNMSVSEVAARLASENVNMASGTVLEGDTEYLVRILNEYRGPAEIAQTVLRHEGTSVVRLADVATVRRATRERDVITRINGRESVHLEVFKEADANIVELAQRVRDRVLGTDKQRAWVAQLRAGDIEDPDLQLADFQARVDADPALLEAMRYVRGNSEGEHGGRQGRGRGRYGDHGGESSHESNLDDLPNEQRELVEQLKAEDAEIRQALRDKKSAYDTLEALLPDGSVSLLSDQSRFIQSALDEVRGAALFGALMSVLVLYLFLGRLGTTLIIAVAIPVSVVVTFVPLHLSSTTLNVMSLGGLALGIGMVVDNAIIVLESIARLREQGMDRLRAAVSGVREVAGAATASTLTTVAVFAPIVFVEGIAGQVFRDQALTVVASLLVSLLVALFLVPMLASRGSGAARRSEDAERPAARTAALLRAPLDSLAGLRTDRARLTGARAILWLLVAPMRALHLALELTGRTLLLAATLGTALLAGMGTVLGFTFRTLMAVPSRIFRLAFDALHATYPPFLRRLVGSPLGTGLTLLLCTALMLWMVHATGALGSELLPEVHQGEIVGRLSMPVGTPLETTDRLARMAEQALTDHPDVAWTSVTVGVPHDEISQPDEGEHSVRLVVGIRPAQDMAAAEERVITALRNRLAEVPNLREARFERPALFTVRAPIVVEIKGEDLDALARTATEVEAVLKKIPGLLDVRSSVQPGSPEIMLTFDRDLLSRHGLDTRSLATSVADLVQGRVATRFADAEHRLDVLVRMDRKELTSIEDLMELPANPQSSAPEPLQSLATSRIREGPREVRRIWGQRAAVVSASLGGFDVGRATSEIRDRIEQIESRSDLVIGVGGQARQMEGALGQMGQALLLAVFLVYVVMAAIFESLLQPLIILVTVPLALVGAVAALGLLDIPLSVVVFIGAIILAGIVVNNAIVLIDAINRRRRLDGMELVEAVVLAAKMRLRPILMTTLTTVIGLYPLTGWWPFEGGAGTELRAPLAVTVVAGLSLATLLTLVVIPTVYVVVERALERRQGRQVSA